ncbi:hypothetical protein SAMN05446935_7388 [Burkholderia sp. YR290]|nr:hypothetical protein SAMN05446935_7388 [Burkholderia sp. YR290]
MISRMEELLRNNEAFVEHQLQLDAGYFNELAEGQHPQFPWIGCSDSRLHRTVSRAPIPATCSCTGTSRTWSCKPT